MYLFVSLCVILKKYQRNNKFWKGRYTMKIALYEELVKAFEDYNKERNEDGQLDWYFLICNIEDRENAEEISLLIQALKNQIKGAK